MGLKGGAFSVFGYDLDLVKFRPEVRFGEHARIRHVVYAHVDAGNGVAYKFWVNALRRR